MLPVSDPLGCVELAHGRNEVYHVTRLQSMTQ